MQKWPPIEMAYWETSPVILYPAPDHLKWLSSSRTIRPPTISMDLGIVKLWKGYSKRVLTFGVNSKVRHMDIHTRTRAPPSVATLATFLFLYFLTKHWGFVQSVSRCLWLVKCDGSIDSRWCGHLWKLTALRGGALKRCIWVIGTERTGAEWWQVEAAAPVFCSLLPVLESTWWCCRSAHHQHPSHCRSLVFCCKSFRVAASSSLSGRGALGEHPLCAFSQCPGSGRLCVLPSSFSKVLGDLVDTVL